MTQLDYDQLDPGIRETVRLIRSWGYETTDSGDGRSKVGVGTDPEICTVPHVAVVMPDRGWDSGMDDADELWHKIVLFFDGDANVPSGVLVEFTYEARQGAELVLVVGLDDAMLPSRSEVKR